MKSSVVKFNAQDRPEFFKVLRSRVNQYFRERNISRHANWNMKLKTVFMLCLYSIPLLLMLTGVVSSLWTVMLMWVLMGLGMSGVGLAIMHDANHGSYSRNPRVNRALGYLLNLIGGYHINWKIQHNVLHHSFTNVHDHDEDIKNALLRFSPNQERKPFNRYQVFYAPLLYGLMSIYWILVKDFIQIVHYSRRELLAAQGRTFPKAITELIINKSWYLGLTLVLPMIVLPLPWWQVLLGFLLMHYITGLALALVFQPAHVVEETSFYKADESGSVENSWAIHQLRTTANFANRNPVLTWLIGGLNFQIEHHLFPNICHVHYRKISRIVRQTAEEFGIPYHHHKTFIGAIRSHFVLLHQLGTGKYDRMMAVAKA